MSVYFAENKTEAGHGQRSLRSGAVSLMARGANALIQIGAVLFLSRLLSPEDYGLVSMVTSIVGFAPSLVDLGTHDAVVQRPEIGEREVSALFWLTMLIGCGSGLAVAACGPLIAKLYGEPRLTRITVVSSITFVTSALTCQHYALLRRAMKFQEIGFIEMAANLLSASSAVTIAFFGFHYWALVLRPIMMTSLIAVGVWVRCGWVPPKPALTTGVREMVKFGLHSTGFTMTDFFGRSADRVVIGYRTGPRALGFYQNAMFVYDNLVDVMVFPLHGVAVASLSKVRGNPEELRRLWRKALSTLVFYSMPAFGILAVTSRDVIALLLGAKWASAGTLLSVLALRGIPHAIERTSGWLHVAAGRSDRWMRWGILGTCAQLLALLCGASFGPMGISTAYVICTFLLFIPAIAYSGQPFGIGAREVVSTVWRPLAGSLLAAAGGFVLKYTVLANVNGVLRAAVLLVAYLATYLALVVGLFGEHKPIWVVLRLVQDYLPAWLARRIGRESFLGIPPPSA